MLVTQQRGRGRPCALLGLPPSLSLGRLTHSPSRRESGLSSPGTPAAWSPCVKEGRRKTFPLRCQLRGHRAPLNPPSTAHHYGGLLGPGPWHTRGPRRGRSRGLAQVGPGQPLPLQRGRPGAVTDQGEPLGCTTHPQGPAGGGQGQEQGRAQLLWLSGEWRGTSLGRRPRAQMVLIAAASSSEKQSSRPGRALSWVGFDPSPSSLA